ncbi:hypothetical protein [Rhizobium gallicum]|uniref:hypothetical protein n=2 Tax=Rhizobium TaxID=379 RepID=UPI001EF977BC|nr:hypothetical protein [Rhizobium gallicum]ULJ75555.1 hypothetical protein L2W42_35910 [Rhizobium gallicum]
MEFDDLKHAQRERLIFLDQCLTWRGMANRRDLIDRFDISTAQAALDFRLYLERARHTPPTYDPVRKTYLAALDHKPLVPSTLNEAFAAVLAESNLPLSVALPQPERRADASVVSRLYQAMRNRWAIHIQYTSMTSGADAGQWIVPTHFVSDGEKVHVRAFSFKHEEYRTYLPIRVSTGSSFETRALSEQLPDDKDWNMRARIWLGPKTGLTPEQAAVVRTEYGFEGELLCVETRKALEFFLDRRWGLDQEDARLERVRTEYDDDLEKTTGRRSVTIG